MVVAGEVKADIPFRSVVSTLGALGDELAKRLCDISDARAQAAVHAWESREEIALKDRLAIAIGVTAQRLEELSAGSTLADMFELSTQFEPNELVAAARMMGDALSPKHMKNVLARLRRVKPRASERLGQYTQAVKDMREETRDAPPFDQGYALARWFRKEVLRIPDMERVDPEGFLTSQGVDVQRASLDTELIDAICVWGPRHGPSILLNSEGRHNSGAAGLRATLAHELCHVLADRDGALPFAEVLGGRVSRRVEARARAFAAELLAPIGEVGPAFASSSDPRQTMRALQRRYMVSQEVIAWQARNSGQTLPSATWEYLRTCVSRPGRF